MVKILVACTGSIATIKLSKLLNSLSQNLCGNVEMKVVVTKAAKHFMSAAQEEEFPSTVTIYEDSDEWMSWTQRGDPVLHIELGKWADILLIAPLDANTLAKISNGICDNLLTCIARAWDLEKPLLFCPAMNTRMYDHPLTASQVSQLESWGYVHVPSTEKTLMCGDTGIGAMAEINTIVSYVSSNLKKQDR